MSELVVERTTQSVAVGEYALMKQGEQELPVYVIGHCPADPTRVLALIIPLRRVEAITITGLDAVTIAAICGGLLGCTAVLGGFGKGEIVREEFVTNENFPGGMLHVVARGTLDPSDCSEKKGNLGLTSALTPITTVALLRAQ